MRVEVVDEGGTYHLVIDGRTYNGSGNNGEEMWHGFFNNFGSAHECCAVMGSSKHHGDTYVFAAIASNTVTDNETAL